VSFGLCLGGRVNFSASLQLIVIQKPLFINTNFQAPKTAAKNNNLNAGASALLDVGASLWAKHRNIIVLNLVRNFF